MKKILVILLALAIVPAAFAAGRAKSHKTKKKMAKTCQVVPAKRLINRLNKVTAAGLIIFGHDDDPVYGHGWCGDKDRSDVKSVCGDYPGIMNWDLGMIEKCADKELDGVPFDRIRSEVVAQDARGGINTFSWHPRNPVTGGDAWDVKNDSTVHLCITDEAMNDTLRTWIGRAADFIGSLRDAKGNRIPVVFRPWHEMNGSWFWWGAKHCSVQDYVALWQITREVFDKKGINNVVWAYSPNIVANKAEYLATYPGDKYVDLLGADCYQFNDEKGTNDYIKNLTSSLDAATAVAKEHGKLVALTETGCQTLKVADWWMGVLYPVMVKYPICYVTVWRNAHDKNEHFFAPYPGQASAPSFVKFYNDKKTVFAREMKTIK
jgi:mannan endo-1,4-beta-mannosidase